MNMTIKKLVPIGMTTLLLALAGCDVEKTADGELPDVDVDVDSGQLPEYDVDAPDVDIEEKSVEVPTIDVDPANSDVEDQLEEEEDSE
jgi:hypothetical protein